MFIIKNIFQKLGVFVENNTVPIIMIALLLIIISFQGAQLIGMASGTDTFVEKSSKLYQDYDHLYLNLFGTESIVVMVEGSDVTEPELLKALDRAYISVQNIPGVVEVTSPSTIIKEVNYQMTGRSTIPDDSQTIDGIIDSSMPSALMPDDTHAVMSVVLEGTSSDTTKEEILRETETSIELANFPADYNIIVTGDPAFSIAMNEEMNTSMGILLSLSVLLMVVVLYLVFKHVRWRLLPLPIVLVGIIFTFGAMGFLDIPMSMVSMSAFPVLIGLGIDYAIQFHNRIEEELARGETDEEAVIDTIKHTGPAVLIALIITALGFFSLFTSSVPMIQDFGKLLMIGIAMCFISSLFLGVTILYGFDKISKWNILGKLGLKKKSSQHETHIIIDEEHEPDFLEKALKGISTFSMRNPLLILSIAGLLCLGGLYADNLVGIQTDTETFVPQDMPALLELQHMGEILGGDDQLNLIIKTDDNADPELLEWIDDFSEHEVDGRSHIQDSSSIVDLVKAANSGEIPDSSEEVRAIYDQLSDTQKDAYINGNSIIMLNLNIGNAMSELGLEGIEALSNVVEEDLQWMAPPPGVHVTITGHSMVYVEVISALTSGRVFMTMLGIALVFAGLLVIYRDILKALTPVLTMVVVVGWSGGLMYYTGMEYTPMTATLGALILGVGSEYAILMMERYFEEREKGADPEEAMQEASVKIGKAIVTSGATTVFGFSALIASPFSITSNFGVITVMDVILALFATFVIFPPIIVTLDKYREKRRHFHETHNRSGSGGSNILKSIQEAITQ
ncbi:hydrophobe/amphiphile efflux-3 family protein [Methanolobus tindarius DSM 2278]|uniref:Hydrophobe/amphiphile efflux-3 family protein n=2 Tax=Methanolobus tindarius TaxID=2221 RepID=W9DPF8_METTI|nr:hydrophobe/amphiphile efflux-3 family protein [Methanolobus tindarius DSM 2278]